MEEDINNLKTYFRIYSEFQSKVQAYVENIERIVNDDQQTFRETELVRDDSSITLNFCGRRVKLAFDIDVSKDKGYIRWYHIYFDDEKQKQRGHKLFEHYFDHIGNIYVDPSNSTALYSARVGFDNYLKKNLLAAFKKQDSENE